MKKMEVGKNTVSMKYPSSWWHGLWREGLVSGNGIIGANVYGGTKTETYLLTHGALWHAGKQDQLPDVSDAFHEMRKKMDQGEFREASWEIVNHLKKLDYQTVLESPLPLADLKVQITPKAGFTQYLRAIQMDTGEVSSQWLDDDVFIKKDLFVSRSDDMIVFRIQANKPELEVRFSIDMHYNTEGELPDYCKHILESKCTKVEDSYLFYSAKNVDHTDYGAVVKICPVDGSLEKEDDHILVKDSRSILVFVKLFIKGKKKEELEQIKCSMEGLKEGYDYYLASHVKLHKVLYNSASLEFGIQKNHCNEELLLEAYSTKQSPELIEKMWKFGRYLFISGSCEKGLPFTMYGLWGGEYGLTWCHNMSNENIQMIYWHCFVGNLMDHHKAFFNYYNNRISQFQLNAAHLYGCRGIFMTAGTTPNVTAPNQVVSVIMNWVGASGWLAQHFYTYYLYTKDEQYLKDTIIPYMDEVAKFYEDFITYYPDGSIKFYPSVSPENTPQNFMPPTNIQMAHPMPTTINSTIDLAIVKGFFTNMVVIAKEQSLFGDRTVEWEKILNSIPDYKINEKGAIKEWQEDIFEDRYDHRHLSHIYPVFPGLEINTVTHKDQIPMYEKAVKLREIDAQTGWSMAHMAAIYARFDDGNQAMRCLDNMAKSSLLNNLFTLHNDWRNMNISLSMEEAPVQLDAILGYVNAVQEMILYSSRDLIKLLPALPDVLKKGQVKQFCFVAGTVDIDWNYLNETFEAVLYGDREHELEICLPEHFEHYIFETKNCVVLNKSNKLIQVKFQNSSELKIKVSK